MDEIERCINETVPVMALIMMSAMPAIVDSITRVIIGPGLEKRLGRPLSGWHWQVYWEEERAKRQARDMAAMQDQACASWNNLMTQLQQMATDRQKIHDFVWGVDTTSPQTETYYQTLLAAAGRAIK